MIYIILTLVAMAASVAHALYDPASRTARPVRVPEPDWAALLRREPDTADEDWPL